MTRQRIREIERQSIRDFLQRQQAYLRGRVLDFGCGLPHTCIQPQPYRDLVNGAYVPFDIGYPEPEGVFDAVLLTQVVQYILDLPVLLASFQQRTRYLVITYPTHWEEVERTDHWRFTRHGMDTLVTRAGFRVIVHERRWSLPFDDFELAGGYGLVAESVRRPDHAG